MAYGGQFLGAIGETQDASVTFPDTSGNTTFVTSANDAGGIDWGDIIKTVLNDVTQIIKPNSPSIHPLYNPASTALGKSNLLPLAAIGVAVYLLLQRRRR